MSDEAWIAANQRSLAAALDRVRAALGRHVGEAAGSGEEAPSPDEAPDDAAPELAGPSALETLCAAFGLSPFERDLLLLCAGMELSSAFPALCAAAQGDARRSHPTFSLALAVLPDAHWSALGPGAPLRRFRLIEVGRDEGLTRSPLRIDEWALHFLTGTGALDERLQAISTAIGLHGELPPSQQTIVDRIAVLDAGPLAGAMIVLAGGDAVSRRAIAAAAGAARGAPVFLVRAAQLPGPAAELDAIALLWEREARVRGAALVLEIGDDDGAEVTKSARAFAERAPVPLFVSGRDPFRAEGRPSVRLDVRRPTRDEQEALWRAITRPLGSELDAEIARVASHFDLGFTAIVAACADLQSRADELNGAGDTRLWDACRAQARPRLEDLAQRIEPAAGWDDLVLPPAQRRTLREITAHVRQRTRVYETWGFGAKSARGLGIGALFTGASGTGKTMAAEVLAAELHLDLYRIDLSQVVSKYIGETEKNLRRVFDAAEEGAAILLFDEADALFGKRSEVKDSHDRYANIEVGYLLQRMESYRGLAVLTTNMKESLDRSFLRRLRFVVEFPFPGPVERLEIWRRAFPARAPTEGLDGATLARLNVAGGNIRNIALNAAFLAADSGEPVRMSHVLRAAQGEYNKLERALTEVEIGGLP